MVGAAVSSGPRFAPADPTLPPPWRALVDGNTGYIYYWNTETNVTQYEKPIPPQPPQGPPLPTGPPPGTPTSVVSKQSAQPAGNLHGGHSVHANSAGNTPENMYGNNSNNPPGNSVHMQGSNVSRSGPGVSAGTVHMNSTDPYVGSGRHMQASTVGAVGRGPQGGLNHATAPRSNSGNVQIQPKLAALPMPQRQQVVFSIHCPCESVRKGKIRLTPG